MEHLDGFDLSPTGVDEAVELVVTVAAGELDLRKLCGHLARWALER